jgi:hypothetical protein
MNGGLDHMKILPSLLAVAVMISAIIAVNPCVSAGEFTADYLIMSDGDTIKSRVFVKGKWRRQVILSQGGGAEVIMIFRPDKGVLWNLIPTQHMYVEQPLSGTPQITMLNLKGLDAEGAVESIGHETVNGYRCEKNKLILKDGTKGTVIQWFSKQLESVVKVKFIDSSGVTQLVAEHTNINERTLSDSLFEVPPGYKKMTMPAMPGGMPQRMSN